ncbi:MAG: GEVED domain-containing protein, partial [Bacteroidota bacterium]
MKKNYLLHLTLLLAVLVGCGSLAFAQTTTFSYTGSVQTYTVPAGCTQIAADVQGAQGGNFTSASSSGGLGGRAQGTIAVTPGQVLYIYVGQQAANSTCGSGSAGGGNSGGGAHGGNGATFGCGGSGGSGSSDIRTTSGSTTAALNSRLLVGGGGGGGGYNCGSENGGAGGGLTGGTGVSCGTYSAAQEGGPGTQTAGGAAGTSPYVGATAGSFGAGGNAYTSHYGAGGGGGWYGAGGASAGSGCGGSSYIGGTGVTAATTTPGFRTGDGVVTITPLLPSVTALRTYTAFGNVTTGTSSVPVGFFTLSGAILSPASGSVTVTAPANFLVSLDGITWSTSVSVSYTGGAFNNQTVYVQFNPTSSIAYSGNITVTGGGLPTTYTIPVTGTGIATACSGAPSAGTAAISPAVGGSTTNFTLSLAGTTAAGGLHYQWQSSPNGSTGWTNIPDAIYPTHSFTGISATTYYRALVSCGTGTPATSSTASATATLTASSCTPTFGTPCTSYYMDARIASLVGVSGSIVDNTTCGGTSYEVMTSMITTLNAGAVYSASIYGGLTYWNNSTVQVWIDFNDNGSFETTETVGGIALNMTSQTQVTSLTIPAGANPGLHRMRIVGNYGCCGNSNYPNINPCPNTSITYGDARDYSVVIAGSVSCSGTPVAGIVSGTPTSACSSFTAALFNVGESTTGVTYQWQSSASASTGFTNIGGATNATYFPGVSANLYYRNLVTCPTSGMSAASPSLQLQVTSPPPAITGTQIVCIGNTSTLANTATGGTWTSSNTAVATVGSATGIVSGVTAGTATVTYRASSGIGCFATATVSVNALPTITSVTPSATSLCIGAALTLTGAGAAGAGTLTSYNWSGPAGYSTTGTATSAVLTTSSTSASGVYSLTVTYPGAGCTSNPATTSSITVSPTPSLTAATNSSPVCNGGTLNLTVAGATNVTGYSWAGPVAITTGGSTASATVSPVTGASGGTYTVTVNNGSGTGCTATYTTVATIAASPTLGGVTNGGPVCANSTLTLSTNTPTNVTGYSWAGPVAITGSTSSSASVPSATTAASGVYSVTVNNGTGSGCTATYTTSATILASSPVYSVTGGGSYCSGGTGVPIGVSNSAPGIQYQLYRGATAVGSTVTGTGSAISFGLQTTPGSYTVSATNTGTSCVANMTGTATVAIGPIPLVYSVTGGGGYCSGGAGSVVSLSNSDVLVSYQLYNGAVAVGAVISGTGSALSFGPQTAGTYSVVANPGSTCATDMTGSATVFTLGLPTVYNVTGGGGYCSGSGGTHIGLDWSNSGVNYQLYQGSTPIGGAVPGVGGAIDFGLITTPGTYSVSGTIASTGCTGPMAGTTTVSINAVPGTFSITGGGSYCAGDAGVTVGLSGSASGIDYQLYNGTATTGSAVAGTGAAISFGSQSAGGTYTVRATNATTGCTSNMTSTATVTINSLPVQYVVTGGGTYCNGGSGVHIYLSGSTTGVNYQLYNGAATVGTPVAGNGSSLDFGFVTASGTYTVMATNAATSCARAQSGSATVVINAIPTAFTVTGGGNYCSGGAGISVGLSNSASGISYQLYNGATTVGSPVSGTGSVIGFGSQTAAGTYSVMATNGATGCSGAMTGTVTVGVNSLPNAYALTGGGQYCSGGTGVNIGVANSSTGVTYQLYNGSTTVGTAVTGTGSAISFGLQTAAGTYSVLATTTATSCTNAMTGTATVVVNTLPTVFNVTGGGQYCSGGTGVAVGLSNSTSGVNYQLYNGSTTVGGPVSGFGSSIGFGLQTSSGTYTVRATDATTTCTVNMTGSATVSINALPTAFTVTGGGNYCSGASGVTVGLGGSTSGVNYQLFNGAATVGGPVGGSGGSISFGLQTAAGTYSVSAVTTATGCTSNMSGTVNVGVNTSPVSYTVTGGGQYCAGSTGVGVGLSGSNTGISYALYNGSSVVSTTTGTGAALSFGTITTAGTYTVLATSISNSCTTGQTGAAVVVVNAMPTVYTVSGGGNYCAGGTGMAVFLNNSSLGINYQLYRGSTPAGSPVAGSGSAINFGLQTTAGTYSVSAANATTGCTSNMSGTTAVVVNAVPTVYSVTGGGQYCAGGTGVNVGLSGSASGISYQLYNGSAAAGAPMAGTGTSLSFGLITTPGNYTIIGTDGTSSCTSNMSGGAAVTVNANPTVYTITGGGQYCTGGTGVNIGLSSSATGISYQLYNGATTSGAPLAGSGLPLDFGLKTAAGTYSVVAVNPATSCTSNMLGAATVTVNANPTVYTVTGGGQYCAGGTGVTVGLGGSAIGVSYQLYSGSAVIGAPVSGTGGTLSFGMFTTAGTYSVAATNTSSSCMSNMSGTATVSVNANPTVYTMTGGGSYCQGGTGVATGLSGSALGVNYQLYSGVTTIGGPISGTGGAISFGNQTAAGTYYAMATNASTTCTANMAGTAGVTINALPTAYTVTGGGNYCSGGTGMNVGLSNSATGISYQLFNGSTAVGSAVPGTGGVLNFGAQTTGGSYNVV